MKCPKCGFLQAAEEDVCKLCGASIKQPVLIKFPTHRPEPRAPVAQGPPGEAPAWRLQLKEKVQAIRARKGLEAAMESAHQREPDPNGSRELPVESKQANPVVEAALSRVRRAGDTDPGSRHSAPHFAPVIKNERGSGYTVTASAALPVESPVEDSSPMPAIQIVASPALEPNVSGVSAPKKAAAFLSGTPSPVRTPAVAEVEEDFDLELEEAVLERPKEVRKIKLDVIPGQSEGLDPELEDDGYLDYSSYRAEAEPSSAAGELQPLPEFQFRTASIPQRLISGSTDVLVVLFACVPFAALMELSNAEFLDAHVQSVFAGIVAFVYILYNSLLMAMSGQTVGMMVTRTVAVDGNNMNLPSLWQGFLRSLGFLLGALPACFGYLWPFLDAEHRSWSDMLSGTTVKVAFEEYPSARLPWLYRHIH